MQKILLFGGLTFFVVFITVATSRSDSTPSLPTTAPEEPITGTAVPPDPSSTEPLPHDPFTPYSPGPAPGDTSPKPFWAYEDVSPAQRAVIDRGRAVTGQQVVLDAYGGAAAELAHQAAGQAAEHELGVDDLSSTGVVP